MLHLFTLQAATRIQPISVCLRRQLHHAYGPAPTQLQRPLRSRLPLRASQGTPAPTVVTAAADHASKAASGNDACVKAAFAEAGLSQDATDHILTQYPFYLRWDAEQKLQPAMRRWQQELGDRFVSEVERVPTILLRQPEVEQSKDQYLAAIGIRSPKTLRKKSPAFFRQSLSLMQSKVAFLQQSGFTRAQTLSLLEQHSGLLSRSSAHIEKLLRVTGDIFGCADRETRCEIMVSCRRMGFFVDSPTTLHHNFTYFCTCIGVDDKQMRRAWKHSVFTASPAELDIRLDPIAAQLDATLDEAKRVVRRRPEICCRSPATVALHVAQLHGLGFSHHQVKSMCLQQPSLLALSYQSQLQADKWAFLTCVLQLSHAAIAAKPTMLTLSLSKRLGPRWAYLQHLRLHGLIAFTAAPQVLHSLVFMTDLQFRAAHTTPQLRVYDEHFQKQWQKQWDFLLVDQQLSIRDIGDDPALLHISLRDI